jgi:WD40 repeat protein
VALIKITLVANLHRHQRAVNVARFSSDGTHLATSGDDGALIVWKFHEELNLSQNQTKKESHLEEDLKEEEEDLWNQERWTVLMIR